MTPGGEYALFTTPISVQGDIHDGGRGVESRKVYSDSEEEYLLHDDGEGKGHQEGTIDVLQDGFGRLVKYSSTIEGELVDDLILVQGHPTEKVLNSKSIKKLIVPFTHSSNPELESPTSQFFVSGPSFPGSSHDHLFVLLG